MEKTTFILLTYVLVLKFYLLIICNFCYRIIGVSNVRVGDASVISKIPTGNPASLIMAIGNQLAKYIIHENWQQLSLMMG